MSTTFSDTGLNSGLIAALEEKGYTHPTPIQEQAIPIILSGKDMLGCAQTGTGKTAAFALPIIQLLTESKDRPAQNKNIRSLILTPTRELAIQIEENIQQYSKNSPISHAVVFGGVKQERQVQQLRRGANVLVATPGRLLDLIGQGIISLSQVEIFVLDEADRMLDMGFIHDIRKVLKLLPSRRQSLFFSATMPADIVSLSRDILTDPKKIEISPESTTAETVQQELMYTNKSTKRQLLAHVIKSRNMDQVLVFTRTKHGADRVARDLKKKGVNSAAIHGDKAQNLRQRVLNQFKEGKIQVLVATDIAARGIDIDKLKFVINYEVPNEPEAYVHRIGRSGRAGEEGIAISFSEPEENAYVRDIEKLIGKKLPVVSDHPFPQTDKPMTEAEKKEWRKEKEKRKQEFFANRKKNKQGQGSGRKKDTRRRKKENGDKKEGNKHPKSQAPSSDSNKPAKKKKKKRSGNKNQTTDQSPEQPVSKRAAKQTDAYRGRLMWPLE